MMLICTVDMAMNNDQKLLQRPGKIIWFVKLLVLLDCWILWFILSETNCFGDGNLS